VILRRRAKHKIHHEGTKDTKKSKTNLFSLHRSAMPRMNGTDALFNHKLSLFFVSFVASWWIF